jgi:enhancing lycopene biosynthesis protein 2
MKKIGVILSGSGVYDGSEIHEATLCLLAIARQGGQAVCMAPNKDQHHVIDHTKGEEMEENRNVLIESARIARGDIQDISNVQMKDLDALMIPGGFGAAKNLSSWAFDGPKAEIDTHVKRLILECLKSKKPLGAMCMGPTLIALATQGTDTHVTLTVGSDEADSPYDIAGISAGMKSLGSIPVMKTVHQIAVDTENHVVTAPCYMMEASILDVHGNIEALTEKLFELFLS